MIPELDVSTLPKKEEDAALKLIASAFSSFNVCRKHRITWRNNVMLKGKILKSRKDPNIWLRIELVHKHGEYYQLTMYKRVEDEREICLGSRSVTDTRLSLSNSVTLVQPPIYQTENLFSCLPYQS